MVGMKLRAWAWLCAACGVALAAPTNSSGTPCSDSTWTRLFEYSPTISRPRATAIAVCAAPRASARIRGRAHHAVAASVACGRFWIKWQRVWSAWQSLCGNQPVSQGGDIVASMA